MQQRQELGLRQVEQQGRQLQRPTQVELPQQASSRQRRASMLEQQMLDSEPPQLQLVLQSPVRVLPLESVRVAACLQTLEEPQSQQLQV